MYQRARPQRQRVEHAAAVARGIRSLKKIEPVSNGLAPHPWARRVALASLLLKYCLRQQAVSGGNGEPERPCRVYMTLEPFPT